MENKDKKINAVSEIRKHIGFLETQLGHLRQSELSPDRIEETLRLKFPLIDEKLNDVHGVIDKDKLEDIIQQQIYWFEEKIEMLEKGKP